LTTRTFSDTFFAMFFFLSVALAERFVFFETQKIHIM